MSDPKPSASYGNEQVLVRMPPELIALVDEARRVEIDIPTRPEMIRRILSRHFEK